MNAYFLGLIVFAFVGSVVLSLAPSGTSKGYVRLLCGLCSVGCVAFPLFGFASEGIDSGEIAALFEPYDELDADNVEIYNSALNDSALRNSEEVLKTEIMQELSANYDDFEVEISVLKNGDEFSIDKIIVTLYPSGYALDPKAISDICEGALCAECEFVYK